MTQKTTGQIDLMDSFIARKHSLNEQLDRINNLINWKIFENLLSNVFCARTGRPGYNALMLFKALVLQSWYNLSDYALEEALDDRLSFRRFIGLSVGEQAPDHSTISRFRDRLSELKLTEKLFIALHDYLKEKGLIVKKGTLVDATFVEAAVKRPDQKEDGTGGSSETDKEAKWALQGKKRHFGYKGHVGVDMKSGIIRKVTMTPANVYEGHVFKEMVSGDEEWVIADKAYESHANNDYLKKRNIGSGLMMNARGCYPLEPTERLFNKIMSKHRSAVERVFGTLKRIYGFRRVRYRGEKKNRSWFLVLCMAYNMRKMEKLWT